MALTTLLDAARALPTERRTEILSRLRDLSSEQQATLVTALRLEIRERCHANGWLWLSFVKTRDEADPNQTVKPFPRYLEYVRAIWQELADPNHKRVICAKSRQMIMSWIVCAFATWWARSKPNTFVAIQTQKYDDACKLVSMAGGTQAGYLGRCQFIERYLPEWLQSPGLREGQGTLTYPNGSMIEGLAGGADQIRGKVPSLIILDEFGYQLEAKGVYTAINPLVQKGTKLIVVSTPNGFSGNMFASLYHGLSFMDAHSANVAT